MQLSHVRSILVLIAVAGVLGGAHAPASAAPSAPPGGPASRVNETEHSETALRAIVEHWGNAEVEGEVAYLEQLLASEYRSISANGVAHPRAMILEHARRNADSAEARKSRDAYKKAHPTGIAVVIHGAIGIVSYYNPQRGLDQSVRGADVFVYEGDHWHAIYSMHNSAT
jgi:hypothetical protein